MEMNFCRRCGTKLTPKSEGMFLCENEHKLFSAAAPTVGVFFITDDNQVILSVRGIEPDKGKLDSFGGFVDLHESTEQALERELVEEVGLTAENYEAPKFLCTATSKYLYDGEERTVLSTFFWSKLKPGAVPVAADDVAELRTIPLSEIQLDEFGGDDVKVAIPKLQELFL